MLLSFVRVQSLSPRPSSDTYISFLLVVTQTADSDEGSRQESPARGHSRQAGHDQGVRRFTPSRERK